MTVQSSMPIIDVSALGGADAKAHAQTVAQIRTAATNNGFFYVSGHGIDPALIRDLVTAAKTFFALPDAGKMDCYIGKSPNHRGYVPAGEEQLGGGTKDTKEAFDLSIDLPQDDPDFLAGNPMLGPNQWPAELPGFKAAVMAYYNAAYGLGERLTRGFSEALGLKATALDGFFTKPPSQLRLIHYPFNPDPVVDAPGIGAHTDYEVFTLLLPTAPGLEVMNSEGEWIDAPPVEGALVVNIGDVLQMWSNDTFVATSHRVRKVSEERYSFPLFFACDYDVEVKPLDSFVTADNPSRYKPIIAGEHLFAQTAMTFSYLKNRIAEGTLVLPEGTHDLSSFGQEANTNKAKVV